MRPILVFALMLILPGTGSAATLVPPYGPPLKPAPSYTTFWYLGAKPVLALPDGPAIERNQGYMVVEADRAGQTSIGSFPGIGSPPFSSGPELAAAFTLRQAEFNFWNVRFDERGEPERWNFVSTFRDRDDFAVVDWRAGDSYTLPLAPLPDDPDSGAPKLVFEAPPGTWFRSEAAYVAAAREAGVEPIPLPAAAWLILAALAALGLLRRTRNAEA